MDNLHIQATKLSPEIDFNAQTHLLTLTGQSYPENAFKFYAPVLQWIETYLQQLSDDQPTIVNVEMKYFNSSSSKILFDLFDLLDDEFKKNKKIVVNWRYDADNEFSAECGREFAEDIELPFNFVKITE